MKSAWLSHLNFAVSQTRSAASSLVSTLKDVASKKWTYENSPRFFRSSSISAEFREFVDVLAEHEDSFINFPVSDEAALAFDLTDWQADHAFQILDEVESLRSLRYRLCPRHMSEPKFWFIYFTLVGPKLAKQASEAPSPIRGGAVGGSGGGGFSSPAGTPSKRESRIAGEEAMRKAKYLSMIDDVQALETYLDTLYKTAYRCHLENELAGACIGSEEDLYYCRLPDGIEPDLDTYYSEFDLTQYQ